MRKINKILTLISMLFGCFSVSCSKNNSDLKLLAFKELTEEKTKKGISNFSKDTVFLDEEDKAILTAVAVVKNSRRVSFVDLVIYDSIAKTYIVYNEGNGKYTCSSETIYKDDIWVTEIVLKYNPKETDGFIEIKEIKFGGPTKEIEADLESGVTKRINFHKHTYDDEWEVYFPQNGEQPTTDYRVCKDCGTMKQAPFHIIYKLNEPWDGGMTFYAVFNGITLPFDPNKWDVSYTRDENIVLHSMDLTDNCDEYGICMDFVPEFYYFGWGAAVCDSPGYIFVKIVYDLRMTRTFAVHFPEHDVTVVSNF